MLNFTSLKEMQIQTTMIYNLIPVRKAIINETKGEKKEEQVLRECEEKEKSCTLQLGM